MKLGALRIRRDRYHGWRLYWQGCPNPFGRSRSAYRYVRRHGYTRRTAVAVALWVVWGRMPAFRYASRHGYPRVAP